MIIKRSREDIIFDLINGIVLTLALLVVAYPLYFIVIASISDPTAINNGKVFLFPVDITFEGYKRIFSDGTIWTAYGNTIIYAVVGTCINIILTMTIAYPIARKDFSGKKIITLILLITMYFNGGLIPTYMVVNNLGLNNSWWVMVILGGVNVFNVIIARSSLENTIPQELYEAAVIDGCSHFNFFFKIVLPLSKAIIAVLVLYYGVAHWNEYMKGLIYLKDQDKFPLQLVLRSILVQNEVNENMIDDVENILEQQKAAELIKYGVIIVASIPVLIIYPFVQKYFVKGAMVGSVKG